MSRRRGLAALAGIAFLCAGPLPAQEKTKPLRVLATTQSLGNLEPCNCVQGMLGGFPRRLATIRRLRAQGPVLVVDGGDLSGKAFHPALLKAKTRAALELLRESGAAAIAVGENDLRLGIDPLKRLARDAKVQLLGANLLRGEETAFAPSVTVKVGSRRVLVVGVLDPDLGDPTGELTITDPAAAVEKALAVARGADVTVVLFHGSADSARRRLAKVQADVVVCGHDAVAKRPLGKLGRAHLVEALRDARSVACLNLGPPAKLVHVPLDAFVPDDAWARARVDRYYEEVQGLPEPPRRKTEGGQFVGAETCRGCHPKQYEVFAASKHHGAHGRVVKKDPRRAKLPECAQCHVTGRGYVGGFVDMEQTPHLAEVGCESCHGVGSNHARRAPRDGGRGFGMLPGFPGSWKPVCLGCHDKSNSPAFDFPTWLERIKHWRER